jgi:hypothetical protein
MPKLKTKPGALMALVAVVALALILVLTISSSSKPTTAVPNHPSMTVAPKEGSSNTQQAVIVSLSVAFHALYTSSDPRAHVTAADVLTAARPDKGTLVVLKNLSAMPSARSSIALEWKFGGSPVVVCVYLPTTRAKTSAASLAEIAQVVCPKYVVPSGAIADSPHLSTKGS